MVAPAIIGALVGAGLGAAKYKQDQQQEARDRQLSAALMRQSPWTGMKPDPYVAHHSMMEDVGQGALGNAAFFQKNFGEEKKGEAAASVAPPPMQNPPPAAPSSQDTLATGYPQGGGPMRNAVPYSGTSGQYMQPFSTWSYIPQSTQDPYAAPNGQGPMLAQNR